MLVELILLTDKGSGDKIDIIFGKLLTLTNSDGRQLMSFGTLDAKSKELVLDILLSIISSSYTKMKYAMFFALYYTCTDRSGGMGMDGRDSSLVL